MNITVLDDYTDAVSNLKCFHKLANHQVTVLNEHISDIDLLANKLVNADSIILIRERTPITAQLLARLPNLKLISQFGHAPHIDIAACQQHRVLVCSRTVPGRPSYATAELTWGLILASVRRIPQEMQSIKSGTWQTRSALGWVLRGRTLGVYGYGRIGTLVAGYGRAFGMNVLIGARKESQERARADGYEIAESTELLFANSDVLTLHLALRDSTRAIVTSDLLSLMKPSSVFVNTSRAELVASGALESSLKMGKPGWAALDVFEKEPVVDANNTLIQLENVTATPHIGYVEQEGFEIMFDTMIDQILAFEKGTPIHVLT
jgi:D-3-phosphoglycerate dehydrogenase